MKNQNKSNNDDTNDTHYVQSMDRGKWAWADAREVRADVHVQSYVLDQAGFLVCGEVREKNKQNNVKEKG